MNTAELVASWNAMHQRHCPLLGRSSMLKNTFYYPYHWFTSR